MIRLKTQGLIADNKELGKINNQLIIDIIDSTNLKSLSNKNVGAYERRIDRYLPTPAHNMIFQISRKNPRFIENARVVLVKGRLGEAVYFVCDGVWIHPFRLFKGTDKDNIIINPTTLGKAKVRFEKPICHYLYSHYGYTAKDFFDVDFAEDIWKDYFLQYYEWDDIIVNFMKHHFKKRKTKAAAQSTNSFEFIGAAIRVLVKYMKIMYPRVWKREFDSSIRVVIGSTVNNRALYWLEVGKHYIRYSPVNESKFSTRLLETVTHQRNFVMSIDDFIKHLAEQKNQNILNNIDDDTDDEYINNLKNLSFEEVEELITEDKE